MWPNCRASGFWVLDLDVELFGFSVTLCTHQIAWLPHHQKTNRVAGCGNPSLGHTAPSYCKGNEVRHKPAFIRGVSGYVNSQAASHGV